MNNCTNKPLGEGCIPLDSSGKYIGEGCIEIPPEFGPYFLVANLFKELDSEENRRIARLNLGLEYIITKEEYEALLEAISKNEGVIDISTLAAVDGVPHKYNSLNAALTAANILLSEDQKKGGMNIKFIKTTAATYKVVKLNHVVTGTRIPYPLTLESGTYTAKDIEGVDLPVNVDEAVSYYYQEGSNVTSWTITKVTDDIYEYKQYRLKAISWSTNTDDWQDMDVPKLRHLTQAEYDALTEEEKMNGTYYFIEE